LVLFPRLGDHKIKETILGIGTERLESQEIELTAKVDNTIEQRGAAQHPPPIAVQLFASFGNPSGR
jgi:hypothetical protein